jgi:hypothetical protein
LEGGIVTPQRKTYFTQVPLASIRSIVEEEERQKKIKADETDGGTDKKDVEADLLETTTPPGWSGRK